MAKIDLRYFWIVMCSGVAIVLLSFAPIVIPSPEPWVTDWTTWLATYVGIGVTARALWIVADAVAYRLRGGSER